MNNNIKDNSINRKKVISDSNKLPSFKNVVPVKQDSTNYEHQAFTKVFPQTSFIRTSSKTLPEFSAGGPNLTTQNCSRSFSGIHFSEPTPLQPINHANKPIITNGLTRTTQNSSRYILRQNRLNDAEQPNTSLLTRLSNLAQNQPHYATDNPFLNFINSNPTIYFTEPVSPTTLKHENEPREPIFKRSYSNVEGFDKYIPPKLKFQNPPNQQESNKRVTFQLVSRKNNKTFEEDTRTRFGKINLQTGYNIDIQTPYIQLEPETSTTLENIASGIHTPITKASTTSQDSNKQVHTLEKSNKTTPTKDTRESQTTPIDLSNTSKSTKKFKRKKATVTQPKELSNSSVTKSPDTTKSNILEKSNKQNIDISPDTLEDLPLKVNKIPSNTAIPTTPLFSGTESEKFIPKISLTEDQGVSDIDISGSLPVHIIRSSLSHRRQSSYPTFSRSSTENEDSTELIENTTTTNTVVLKNSSQNISSHTHPKANNEYMNFSPDKDYSQIFSSKFRPIVSYSNMVSESITELYPYKPTAPTITNIDDESNCNTSMVQTSQKHYTHHKNKQCHTQPIDKHKSPINRINSPKTHPTNPPKFINSKTNTLTKTPFIPSSDPITQNTPKSRTTSSPKAETNQHIHAKSSQDSHSKPRTASHNFFFMSEEELVFSSASSSKMYNWDNDDYNYTYENTQTEPIFRQPTHTQPTETQAVNTQPIYPQNLYSEPTYPQPIYSQNHIEDGISSSEDSQDVIPQYTPHRESGGHTPIVLVHPYISHRELTHPEEAEDHTQIHSKEKLADFFSTFSSVYIGAALGAFFRLTLAYYFGGYFGHPFYNLWLPNFIGCFLMGIFVYSRSNLDNNLYYGLTTGFCGSLTTFSEIIKTASLSVCNYWFDTITLLFVSISSIVIAYIVGKHGAYLVSSFTKINNFDIALTHALSEAPTEAIHLYTPPNSFKKTWKACFIKFCIIILLYSTLICTLLLTPYNDWKPAYGYPTLASPIGAILRWRLSLFFSKRFQHFPFGTFLSNLIGSLISVLFLASHPHTSSSLKLIENMLAGGFSGCLSTASTLASEIVELQPNISYFYLLVTLALPLLVGYTTVPLSNVCDM